MNTENTVRSSNGKENGYLFFALDQSKRDGLPLLGAVISGQLLNRLCHVYNKIRHFQVSCEAAETGRKCFILLSLS